MARQAEDRALSRLWIAFDPGERWTGVAGLLSSGVNHQAEAYVLDADELGPYQPGDYLASVLQRLSGRFRSTVIAEEYRQRPVGHQRWAGGGTLRLLGVLEYVTRRWEATWEQQLPGDPDEELGLLKLTPWLNRWQELWPVRVDRTWRHALAAWRVLGKHLLWKDVQVLRMLTSAPKFRVGPPALFPGRKGTLGAPTIHWRSP